MQLTHSLFALSSMAALAAALSKADFEFPDTVPLDKRQTEGPAYECHNSCGLAIRGFRDEGYCDSTEWRNYLDECLDCALEFDIWQYYGRLKDIAKNCGIDATPRPVDTSSSAAPTAQPTTLQATTSAAAEPTTASEASSSVAEPTAAESTIAESATAEPTQVHESSSSGVVPTTIVSTVSPSAVVTGDESSIAVSTPSGSPVATSHVSTTTPVIATPTPVSEGSQVLRSGFVAAAGALFIAFNLM